MPPESQQPEPPRIPGRKFVFVFASAAVVVFAGTGFWWWNHSRPYREVRAALLAEFPKSKPLVEGNTLEGGGLTMRVAMTVDFDPQSDKPQCEAIWQKAINKLQPIPAFQTCDSFELFLLRVNRGSKEAVQKFELKGDELRAWRRSS